MNILRIATIGGATFDIIFHSPEGLLIKNPNDITKQNLIGFEYGAKINISQAEFTFGGGASNTAVCFSRLGFKTVSFLNIGNDAIGKSILKNLKNEKVNTKFVGLSEKTSGLSFIITHGKTNKDHVLFTFRGANDNLKINTQNLEKIKPAWIYLTSLSGKNWLGNLNKIFAFKKKSNAKLCWNPGNLQIKTGLLELKAYLLKTDVLILNKDEAIELCLKIKKPSINPKNLLITLKKYMTCDIVLTDGENGAYAFFANKFYFMPVQKIKAEDTTGVGDCFGATFIWGLNFFKGDVRAALEVAMINTASVITLPGAQTGLLTKQEILRRL